MMCEAQQHQTHMYVQVAHMGVTIAAVIHQPSYEIFQMFDDILLLAKGGRTAYYGPEGQVQGYFEGLGYALPQRTNPADVYMDIIAGTRSRTEGPALSPAVRLSLLLRHCLHCGLTKGLWCRLVSSALV